MPSYFKSLRALSFFLFAICANTLGANISWAESALFETRLSAPAPAAESRQQTDAPKTGGGVKNAPPSGTLPSNTPNPNVPNSIVTQYEVSKNGQPFARVKEQFKLSGNQYQVNSVTKGLGVYALLGERKLNSNGELNSEGLKPSHFELHQGDNAKRSLLTDFDWAKNTLRMTVKGQVKTAALVAGTQDLASFPYQFMFRNPADFKKSISMPVTNGKKLDQYLYKVDGEETLQINGQAYKALHITEVDAEKPAAEAKQFWLATEHHYVPIRIMMTEDGAKLEQVLTDMQVE